MGEWREVTLGEVLTFQRGHDLPSQKRTLGEIPIISSSGTTDYHNKAAAIGPGVITGRYGTIGEVFYVASDYWPLNTTLYVKDFKGNDPKFIYYLLKTVNFHQFNDKSSVPGVNRNHAHLARVAIPETPIQRQIAAILSAFDDKIELNRRINRTLEQMARALFKSWFVDFDPVRAKMRGEVPEGMDAETAALFPAEMDEVEGREVPKGWEWTRLDDLLVLQRGFDLPVTERDDGRFPVFSAGGFHGFHSKPMVSGPGVVTGRSGVIGKVFFIPGDFWPLNTTLWVKKFAGIGVNYAFELLRDVDFSAFSAGSAVPTLNRNHIHCLQVVKPPVNVSEKFEEMGTALRNFVIQNDVESAQLASLRDALLPRLLSREVEVSGWGEVISKAASLPD